MFGVMFLKDVLGEVVPPAKIEGLAGVPVAHIPSKYAPPKGAEAAMVVSGTEYDLSSLERYEVRYVIGWFPSVSAAEAAAEKLQGMLTFDTGFLQSEAWGGLLQ